MIVKKAGLHCLIATLLLLSGCGSSPVAPVSDRSAVPIQAHGGYHVVQIGETLYSISQAQGYDYTQVARWNGIPRPYRIYPGQKLRLRPPVANKQNTKSATKKSKHPVKVVKKRSSKSGTVGTRSKGVPKWVWPTKGQLLRTYAANDPGKKGIDIGGRQGQPILAAASGEVVYSGNGLMRYGNLIIIKHNRTFFSAYAHNRRLLVKEGDYVHTGEGIAEMGSSGTNRTMLHFEIRRNGRPVDPLPYLPKR